MLKLALRGVRYNSGRYIATLVAIITGVAFFTAAGFLSDRVIDALEGDVNRQFAGVEAAVVPDDEGTGADFADRPPHQRRDSRPDRGTPRSRRRRR